ncbi:hypothetical protein M8C21_021193, partial [Ambrosia artemisiifolia]
VISHQLSLGGLEMSFVFGDEGSIASVRNEFKNNDLDWLLRSRPFTGKITQINRARIHNQAHKQRPIFAMVAS